MQRDTEEKKVDIFPEKSSIEESREAKIDIDNRLSLKKQEKTLSVLFVIMKRLTENDSGNNNLYLKRQWNTLQGSKKIARICKN